MKKITVPLFILVLLAMVLTACGENATPTTAATGSSPTSSATQTTANTTTTTVAVSTKVTTTTSSATQVRATQTAALAAISASNVTAAGSSGTTTQSGPTATPGTQGGVTMKEAYALVQPLIKSWASDAVLTDITLDPNDQVGLLPDGRADSWFFTAASPSLSKENNWQVKATSGTKPTATETISNALDKQTLANDMDAALPPVSGLIDSNRLMEVARANGGGKSDAPVGFDLHKPANPTDPLAYNLVFTTGNQVTPLRIDAQTGQLLENVHG